MHAKPLLAHKDTHCRCDSDSTFSQDISLPGQIPKCSALCEWAKEFFYYVYQSVLLLELTDYLLYLFIDLVFELLYKQVIKGPLSWQMSEIA